MVVGKAGILRQAATRAGNDAAIELLGTRVAPELRKAVTGTSGKEAAE
jgi:hypothetical protein